MANNPQPENPSKLRAPCRCGHREGQHDTLRTNVDSKTWQLCQKCDCECFTKDHRSKDRRCQLSFLGERYEATPVRPKCGCDPDDEFQCSNPVACLAVERKWEDGALERIMRDLGMQ